jgi:hypothetical protein
VIATGTARLGDLMVLHDAVSSDVDERIDRTPGPFAAAALVAGTGAGAVGAAAGLIAGAYARDLPLIAVSAAGLLFAAAVALHLHRAGQWAAGAAVLRSVAVFAALFAVGWLEGLFRRDLRDDDTD